MPDHLFSSDQHEHWNHLYGRGQPDAPAQPSEFAQELGQQFATQQTILELGGGRGTDACYFAQQGHQVTAIDFSEVAIAQARAVYQHIPDLHFQVVDISYPLPFPENHFSVVYARLSLHYFPDTVTRRIFKEIHRVLNPSGLLAFMCKSIQDPLYGQGKALEKDMYEINEHIRHFFSEDYVKICLNEHFTIQHTESHDAELYGMKSACIKVIAHKT